MTTATGIRSADRNSVLATLGDFIREISNPDDLAYAAAELLGRSLNVSRAGYGTVDTSAETITIVRDWNAPGILSLAGVLRFRDYGSYIEDLKRGETVICADAEKDPRVGDRAEALEAISARALVNMPISEADGVVALLYLNNAGPREWSPEELELIRDVAERTRTAVERRRAETAVRENEARLLFLDALNKETARTRDADGVMAVTTRMLGEHLEVSSCAYADMDPDQDGFTIRGDWAAPGAVHILGHYSLADFGKKAVRELGAGRPLIINDNLKELAPEEAATFQNIGIGSTDLHALGQRRATHRLDGDPSPGPAPVDAARTRLAHRSDRTVVGPHRARPIGTGGAGGRRTTDACKQGGWYRHLGLRPGQQRSSMG
ncbi:GAF domain-containing protein [Bradyrhizobium sp. GM5.1]